MKVLIISAHPDDEVLGCGGTIAYHVAKGDTVKVLYLSEGVTSRSEIGKIYDWTKEIEERETFARAAANILGFEILDFFRYPNLRMRDMSMLDIVKRIDQEIRKYSPNWIYTNHAGDMNSDHAVTFEATLTACRPRFNLSVNSIFTYEVPSSTEWGSPLLGPSYIPNRFIGIKNFMQKKLDSLSAYAYEMRSFPHPRSNEAIEALAKYRGSSCGVPYAEAFMIVREVL